MHVYQPVSQVCKPGESLALRKVKHPLNGRTSVSRLPLTKQDILSQYSGCFEGTRCFPGDPYKFHLKPDHKPTQHAPRKVPVHLETTFKEEIKSLVKQGILEEVKEHTDWVNLYVIVEKDTGNHHSPNHTVKKKLRICLDPRDLKEALEREPYHTKSLDEITAKLQGMTVFTIANFKTPSTREITAKFPSRDKVEHARHFPTSMEMCMDDRLTLTTEKIQQKQFQDKAYEQCCSTHSISPHSQKNTICNHAELPPGMENILIFLGNQFLQGKEKFVDTGTFTLGTFILIFLNRYSALSALTYQENFKKMEISNMKALPYFNANAETTLQMDASKKGSRASLIQKGKDIPVTDTFSQVTPMNPEDHIQLSIRKANMITTHILTHISTCILISVQSQDSLSNKLD